MENESREDRKQWMGAVRGNLLRQITTKIETDSAAMIRVGMFLSEIGTTLLKANVFALQLAVRYAEGNRKPVVKNGSAG